MVRLAACSSKRAGGSSPRWRPRGADPDALRQLVQELVQSTLEPLAADRNDQWAKRRYVVPASPTVNVHNVTRARRVA